MGGNKAFTLVELIVVITILAILGTVGFISLQGYGSESRDVVRLSDLNSINKALELSKVDYGDYPDPVDYDSSVNNWKQGVIGKELVERFKGISNVPLDPVSQEPMWYATTLDNKEYQLMYGLETDSYSYISNKTHAQNKYRAKILGNYNTFYVVGEDKNYYAAPSLHSSGSVFFIDGESINFTSEALLDQSGANINASNIKSKYVDFTLSLLDTYETIPELDNSLHTELKSLDRNDGIKLAEFAIKLLGHNPQNLEQFIIDNPDITVPTNPDEETTPPSEGTNPPDGGDETTPGDEITIPGDETTPGKCIDSTTPTDAGYFNFDESTGTITNFNPRYGPIIKNLVIPCEINGKKVTHIGNNAFMFNDLESVVLSDNIKSVGSKAFFSINLTSIDLGEGLETIGLEAFRGNNISNVTIPDSVISIGNYAFYGIKITTLTLGNNLETIGESAFQLNDITQLVIPDNVTNIGESAFQSNDITQLVIPDNVTNIGEGVFRGNNISNVTIPDSVISIGNYAFYRSKITTLTLGNNLETIGESAFQLNDITQLVIPDNVTNIGESAFQSNDITQLVIPDNVTNIGESAFRSNDIFELTILGDNLVLGLYAFRSQGGEEGPIISPKYFCDTYYNEDYIDTNDLTSCSQ